MTETEKSISILALDLGTKTGWALMVPSQTVMSGAKILDLNRRDSHGMRILRFCAWLREIRDLSRKLKEARVVVAYEQPIAYKGRIGGSLFAHELEGALLATVSEDCEIASVVPGTLKRHATGKGNSSKTAMVRAARKRWDMPDLDDEDEADALCVLSWCMNELGVSDDKAENELKALGG